MPELILASASVSRRQILEGAGLPVRVEVARVQEELEEGVGPERMAVRLALLKATEVHRRFPDAWVLGADQVVWDGAELSGKPQDPADHLARLMAMRGKAHRLVTGFALLAPGVRRTGVESTVMKVRAELSREELLAYVKSGEGSGCAGGYAAEGHGAWLFEAVEGDWFNVLGLPLFRVLTMLREEGWRYGVRG
ncbi:MAG: septum formation protein Maf [Deltaproteobacteria bacterium]|nr:septum formation protein Maf [Deltaproteobacteria bacterium]